jgi:hypothetical protein
MALWYLASKKNDGAAEHLFCSISGSQHFGARGALGIFIFFAAHWNQNRELKFIIRVHLFQVTSFYENIESS